MSYMVVNVLLRGLVIYAVLGSECSYSNDLPSHSSDAANVATSGNRVFHEICCHVTRRKSRKLVLPCWQMLSHKTPLYKWVNCFFILWYTFIKAKQNMSLVVS
ncbi:hypothetical protein ATANTOWER_011078 [Ataeniobius toweri]|uniref:Secreted protein n=1 Tax=Ataeniobius toweri TaxID=208326 RepID=A0ABU7AKB0_9TELE|nr:hypothetical protein [Ataeniobius toweri]